MPEPRYDRTAASRVLAALAAGGLFSTPDGPTDPGLLGPPRVVRYRSSPVEPAPGSHLTLAQLGYLQAYMAPCRPEQVTSATVRIGWDDADGVPNVAHHGPAGWGAVVPVVAREAMLALRRDLLSQQGFARRAAALDDDDRAVLAGTTTDADPAEIVRVGVEAAARALVQHAYVADGAPWTTPAAFARGLRDSDLFGVVASTWYWELQASTHRRGMVPVRLVTGPDGTVRYPPETVAVLRAMKDRTVADAHAVMARATGDEGMSVEDAVQRYHVERDEISRQYALLPAGEHPRCLGVMTHDVDGRRTSVLPAVAHAFVETFVRLLDLVTLEEDPSPLPDPTVIVDLRERTFHVPDMNCQHCKATITGVLVGMEVEVVDFDLEHKRVVAAFPTVDVREEAFEAIRAAGFTVLPPRR